MATGKL